MTKQNEKDAKRVPELRFKGFTDDWEQRKLGEIATIVGGGTPSTKNPEYWDGDINWYSPAEIGNQIYAKKVKGKSQNWDLRKVLQNYCQSEPYYSPLVLVLEKQQF